MKKLMLLAAGIVLFAVSIVGCTSAAQQAVAKLAADAQTKAIKACALVQPVLLDLSASIPADPNLALLATDNGKLCAAVATLDPSSAAGLVNTVIPQAISLLALLPIDSVTREGIRIALGTASIALSNWLAQSSPPVATVPASDASVPLAASASQ
ncbi:hypothetical protein [Burkholderia perseverans]|uniref:hypothetical protein n=1 Tax=Burkholderia perseverans TaxID=2615214 RepID=UPI001FEE661C|nr:hypothetical protein [Burkholderia perseverans]